MHGNNKNYFKFFRKAKAKSLKKGTCLNSSSDSFECLCEVGYNGVHCENTKKIFSCIKNACQVKIFIAPKSNQKAFILVEFKNF